MVVATLRLFYYLGCNFLNLNDNPTYHTSASDLKSSKIGSVLSRAGPAIERQRQNIVRRVLCPMPKIGYHSFSPSQLPNFPTSHLPGLSRTPQPNTRRQRTEVRRQIFRIQIVLLNAPCPMPIISYHRFSPSQFPIFSPSQLLNFPSSHLPIFLRCPATRNAQLATRNANRVILP